MGVVVPRVESRRADCDSQQLAAPRGQMEAVGIRSASDPATWIVRIGAGRRKIVRFLLRRSREEEATMYMRQAGMTVESGGE